MTFDCPRCGDVTTTEFYGPCPECRERLREIEPPQPDPRFVQITRRGQAAVDVKEAEPMV